MLQVYRQTRPNLKIEKEFSLFNPSTWGSEPTKYEPDAGGRSASGKITTMGKGTQDSPMALPKTPTDMVSGTWYDFPTKDGIKKGRYDGGKSVYFPE
jgi:hypothetical protein